jgi:hypothetical protein
MVPQMEAEGLEVGHQTHIRFFTAEECAYKMNTKMMEKQTRKGTGRTTTDREDSKQELEEEKTSMHFKIMFEP